MSGPSPIGTSSARTYPRGALAQPLDLADAADSGALHVPASRDTWPWLPLSSGGRVARHPYCRACGLVKFVGSNGALPAGGLHNLIARLGRLLSGTGMKITEAQRRLITRDIEADRIHDVYGLSREQQGELLARIIGSRLGLVPEVVMSYLRSC